jgi:hypothetical protein
MTMLDGIVMEIIHVPGIIAVVANQMFPITTLPYTPLSVGDMDS